MLPLLKSDYKPLKCFATHGRFPAYVNPNQLPTTKKPWSAISGLKWCHQADMILPTELVDIVQRELEDPQRAPLGGEVKYAKVIMSLSEILEGRFFEVYIKSGNVMMLMMHNAGTDCVFELHEGILRLEIDKPTYETIGLPGKAIPDGGLKHKKNRYAIELNLRLPSMLHGKKGFGRIVWAFKNAKGLQDSFEWLFYDCAPNVVGDGVAPVEKHHPEWFTAKAQIHVLDKVTIPNMSPAVIASSMADPDVDDTYIAELYEWTSLIALQAPRVQATDAIDPFLCRYSTPRHDYTQDLDGVKETRDMAILRWQGFLPAAFVTGLLLRVIPCRGGTMAALQAHGFRGGDVTVMRLAPPHPQTTTESEFVCLDVAAKV